MNLGLYKLITIFLALFFLFPSGVDAASNRFYFDTVLTYSIKDQNETSVNHHITVTNRTSNYTASSMQIYTTSSAISNVTARYADGRKIDTKVEKVEKSSGDIKYQTNKITLKFSRKTFGDGTSWAFDLNYVAKDFVIKRGSTASIVYIPTVNFSSEDRNYSLKVLAPKKFGDVHTSVISPASAGTSGSRTYVTYNKKQLSKSGIFVSYGDEAFYEFEMVYPLKNPLPIWKTYWVTLPPTLTGQEVFINKISRTPTAMKVDGDGNILAGFRLNPFEGAQITANVTIKVKLLEYDLSIAGMKDALPKELVAEYTKTDRFWETNSEGVKKLAAGGYSESKNVAQNIQSLYLLTIKTLTYNNKKLLFNQRLGAEKAAQQPTNAVCMEFADLLIAMLRSAGIPARNPIGYAYAEGLKPSDTVEDSLHSWVEAYVPNVGWIQVDPTWGEKVDNFGKSDFDHVAFSIYGERSDAPAATHVGNFDLGYQFEDSIWRFGASVEPKTSVDLKVRAIPLPLLALVSVDITNNGNVVMYNQALLADGEKFYPKNAVNLGDSAPFQTTNYYLLGFPQSFANKSASIAFSAASVGTLPAELAQKNFNLPYILSIVEVLLITAIVIFAIVWKVIRTRHAK